MSFLSSLMNALPGAIAQGLAWGIMAIGVYITFRILDVADLTVDGSLATGGAVCVMLIRAGVNPWLAMLCALVSGMLAGLVTGLFHTRCGIPAILAGILTQLALYSINLRIMGGKANQAVSVDKYHLLLSQRYVRELSLDNPLPLLVVLTAVIVAALYWFFGTEKGNSLRATGANPHMARAQGITKAERETYRTMLRDLGLGLETRLSSEVSTLSGGQRQALTLLMATLKSPKLLLLDEHTAALDPKTAAKVMELTDRIVTKEQLTTLMITHNMRDAIQYGSRLVMLHEGRVILDISGEEKKNLTVTDLLAQFAKVSGDEFSSDRALLS